MHHFDAHETLMKNACGHFSVLILRFTMVVYLYNVKYFFVVNRGGQGGVSHRPGREDDYMIRIGGGREGGRAYHCLPSS